MAGAKGKPAASPFPRLCNGLALVLAQRLDRQPGVPQVDLGHGGRRLGQRPGHAVVRAYYRIRDSKVRKCLFHLTKAFAGASKT